MKHPIKTLSLAAFLALTLSACSSTYKVATQKVDDEYIEVLSDQPIAVVEEQLRAAGADYACKELYFGHNAPDNRRACFIKKPADAATVARVRLSDLPMAIVLDTGRNIKVVGDIMLHMLVESWVRHPR